MTLNSIPAKQNAEPQLQLLRAQRQLYNRAKIVMVWQLALTVAVPLVGALSTLALPDLKTLVAFAALTIAMIDVAVLDRLQKRILLSAAKIQEQFDCNIFALPWNKFTIGRPVTPEATYEAAATYARKNDDKLLLDWYPPIIGEVSLHLARIICQRTNLWYDSKLRRHYGAALLILAAVLLVVLFLIGMGGGLTLTNFVLTVMAPAAPFYGWAMREYYRQKDVADAQDRFREEAEELWERARTGKCGASECEAQSREFQNAIFTRRSTSPPIFEWIYRLMRSSNEAQMNVGAEQMIQSIPAAPK